MQVVVLVLFGMELLQQLFLQAVLVVEVMDHVI